MPTIYISTTTYAQFSDKPIELLQSEGYNIKLNDKSRKLTDNEVIEIVEDCDGILAGTETYNQQILNKANKLKVISRLGVGLDNIDLDYAFKKGIKVFKTQTTPAMAVAELTLGLILDLLRKISFQDCLTKNGQWEKHMGLLLSGKTLGIIGLGAIGKTLVEITRGFNINYLAFDKYEDHSFAQKYNVNYTGLDNLLRKSDVVSIHLNFSKEMRNLINCDKLNMMKRSAIIINTARGGIINEADLEKNLKNGLLSGAGLDVYDEEPYAGPLRECNNVLLSPHIGSYAKEIRIKMEQEAAENLIKGLANG